MARYVLLTHTYLVAASQSALAGSMARRGDQRLHARVVPPTTKSYLRIQFCAAPSTWVRACGAKWHRLRGSFGSLDKMFRPRGAHGDHTHVDRVRVVEKKVLQGITTDRALALTPGLWRGLASASGKEASAGSSACVATGTSARSFAGDAAAATSAESCCGVGVPPCPSAGATELLPRPVLAAHPPPPAHPRIFSSTASPPPPTGSLPKSGLLPR